jgi:hypothetical protein
MPANNYKGVGDRVNITTAAAAVTRGVPVVEDGWAGIPVTSAALGAPYVLQVDGEFELDYVASAAVGDLVYITAADGTISLSGGTGKRPFGKVTQVQGDVFGTPTGKMWVRIAPFTYNVTAS